MFRERNVVAAYNSLKKRGILKEKNIKGDGNYLTFPYSHGVLKSMLAKLKARKLESAEAQAEDKANQASETIKQFLHNRYPGLYKHALRHRHPKNGAEQENKEDAAPQSEETKEEAEKRAFNETVKNALTLFMDEKRVAVSLVQQRFQMSYTKAKKIMDALILRGHIGMEAGKNRYIVAISRKQLKEYYGDAE
jgi:hypothetical protein